VVSPHACEMPPASTTLLDILGVFAKLRKITISFVMSVLISVHLEKLGSYWTDFHDILYLKFFRKSVQETQVSVKYD